MSLLAGWPKSLFCHPHHFSRLLRVSDPVVATNEEELRMLIQTQVNAASGCFICMLCGKTVKQRANVRRHFLSAHYDDGTVFKCPVCPGGNYSKSRRGFEHHIYKLHPNLKGLNYAQCRVSAKSDVQ